MHIAHHKISTPLISAPMAGISDLPFRKLCKQFGAGLAISEMVTAQNHLYTSQKTKHRLSHDTDSTPTAVQIVGSDPNMLANAAQLNVKTGADIIDINMGCPAKKVCNKAAGSALLAQPKLVENICRTVVNAVGVPVTIKIRTGPTPENRNAVEIARIAEQSGIKAITIHGRTRQCKFKGNAEYDSIARVKQSVTIPVIANGDIDSADKAAKVLEYTKADGIMIGRAAQGQPWIFQEVAQKLKPDTLFEPLNFVKKTQCILGHLNAIHEFYGSYLGVRIARKHIKWYTAQLDIQINPLTLKKIIKTECCEQQIELVHSIFI